MDLNATIETVTIAIETMKINLTNFIYLKSHQ